MRSSDCIFCPGYDGVFRLYAGTEKFQERSQRKPGDLKGKMAQGGLTAGSIKPVSDPGAGPSLWGSYGDRRHTGNSFCKGLHSYRSYGNGQLPDRMDDPVLGSVMAVVTDFGAMTVLYHQFGFTVPVPAKEYDFPKNREGYSRKRWFLTLTAVFSGIAAFMVFDMVYNGNSPDQAILSQVEITAHRGSSKHAPENTMAAIEEAIGEMADYSEIDVQLSKDGVPVVCHDLNLSRVAGVDVSLKNLTFDELEQLDVGSHFSSRFEGEKIPSLEEVLEACKGRIRLNIELKSIGTKSPLPEVVTEMIKEMGMEDQCVITSVSLDYLKRVKEAEPELKTGYILAAAYGSYYKNEFVDFISIRSSLVTKKQIQAAHEYGKAIHVWTVNSRSEIEQMALMGVDNIITDYPTRAKEVLYQPDVAKNLLTYIRQVMK